LESGKTVVGSGIDGKRENAKLRSGVMAKLLTCQLQQIGRISIKFVMLSQWWGGPNQASKMRRKNLQEETCFCLRMAI
jgi:hypothetical protein